MQVSAMAIDLARIQFAFTVSFHIIFPALSIGLASFVAILEWRWLKTGEAVYLDLCRYWSKVFAVGFGMGVVSGLVMAYEFGTNWSAFSNFSGSITGPLLSYEVLTAFFLEAGFLGIMLFGWDKVSKKAHFAASCMVAIGTIISMFWILSSNSWMQTPTGYSIVNGRVEPQDWFAVIFNPSFPYRLAHMGLSAFIATALLVAGSSAWHLLNGRRDRGVKISFSMALAMLTLLAPLQALVGDAHGLNTLEYQPAKLAAMEGIWETETDGTALNLFGIPDMAAEKTHYAVSIPHLGSLILTHSWNGQIRGLKSFAPQDRPNSLLLFWSFRLMVGLGLLMIALGLLHLWLRRRDRLYDSAALQRFALWMSPAGFIALLAGWVTTEAGRQPWVVYGLLRTNQAVSPISQHQLSVSLSILVCVYLLVFGTGLYYLIKLLRSGPAQHERTAAGDKEQLGALTTWSGRRPISAAETPIDANPNNKE